MYKIQTCIDLINYVIENKNINKDNLIIRFGLARAILNTNYTEYVRDIDIYLKPEEFDKNIFLSDWKFINGKGSFGKTKINIINYVQQPKLEIYMAEDFDEIEYFEYQGLKVVTLDQLNKDYIKLGTDKYNQLYFDDVKELMNCSKGMNVATPWMIDFKHLRPASNNLYFYKYTALHPSNDLLPLVEKLVEHQVHFYMQLKMNDLTYTRLTFNKYNFDIVPPEKEFENFLSLRQFKKSFDEMACNRFNLMENLI